MSNSYIEVGRESTTYVGPDATRLYRAKVLVSACRLFAEGISPSGKVTATATRKSVEALTGKKYKCGEWNVMAADVHQWVVTMECALPVVRS